MSGDAERKVVADTGGELGKAEEGGDGEVRCQRCGFPVPPKPEGCRNPCSNCGFLYPLGDCTD